jgi:hypothetical protein
MERKGGVSQRPGSRLRRGAHVAREDGMRSALLLSVVSVAFLSLFGLARQNVSRSPAAELDADPHEEEVLFIG